VVSPITGGKIVLAGTLTRGSSLLPFHRHKGSWVRFDVDDTDEDEGEDEDNINHYAKVLNPGEELWVMPIISEARQTHNRPILQSTEGVNHGIAEYRRFGSFEINDKADPEIVKAFFGGEWVTRTIRII